LSTRTTEPHDNTPPPAPYPLWSGGDIPISTEIPLLEETRFSVIRPHQPDIDGGRWLLGTALAWHRGSLYASYGFNTNPDENTATEQAHCRISDDDGQTWGDAVIIDDGQDNLGVSHGVFLARDDALWAFHGAFYDHFLRTHTRAYLLDDAAGAWQPKGVVVGEGFWPLQEPQKMPDGNWIMAGARVADGVLGDKAPGNLPAVAISGGDDLTAWDLVVIPPADGVEGIWGESNVIVKGAEVLNISRWAGRRIPERARALAAYSSDCGRTWTPTRPSNLPMATSKPCTGTLSTGQNYLICTTAADRGGRRSPLTIALSQPGELTFSKVFTIRPAVFPDGPGPSFPEADLSYPYATEHNNKLYVGYAIKRHPTAEMAVIPISALAGNLMRRPGHQKIKAKD